MKKFLLSFALVALVFGADAQLVPLKVYNGMPFDIRLNSVAVRNSTTCAGGVVNTVNIIIPANTLTTVAPLVPGDSSIEWAGAKVSTVSFSSYLRAIHPHFETCWLPSASGGATTMNGYWYPIGASPYQVLKVYPL